MSAGLHSEGDALIAIVAAVSVVPPAALVVAAKEVEVMVVRRCVDTDCPCAGAAVRVPLEIDLPGGVAGRPAEVKTRERARWRGLVDIALCRVLSDTGLGLNFSGHSGRVGLDKGEYVRMTEFLSNQADPDLFDIGVTGVLRSHRRRGIATALKLRGIEVAQKRGIRELRTWNASSNEGILAVNRRLGFLRRPAHIAYVKEVRAEDGELTLGG